jgi:hypothetical protein
MLRKLNCLNTQRSCVMLNKPVMTRVWLVKKQRVINPPTQAFGIEQIVTIGSVIDTTSYLVGKSIILYTMFYCSLNWLHYRRLRKQLEDEEKKD